MTHDDPRKYERFFQIGIFWMSEQEFDEVRKALGSAAEIIERTRYVDQRRKKDEQREAIWLFMRRVGVAFTALVGVAVTVKALLPAAWWPW